MRSPDQVAELGPEVKSYQDQGMTSPMFYVCVRTTETVLPTRYLTKDGSWSIGCGLHSMWPTRAEAWGALSQFLAGGVA